jgi:hypothetical protein
MLKDLADSHQPDEGFKKSQKSGREFSSSQHINDPHCIDRDVEYSGEKNQQGQQQKTEDSFRNA